MTPQISPRLSKNRLRHSRELMIEILLMLAALSAVFITFAIVGILIAESIGFFKTVSIIEFFTSKEWTPLFDEPSYGILPLVAGTLTTSAVALMVAIPLGTIGAVYLSEFASHRVRETVKPALELLVGVPTIVFGYFALLFVTPLLQKMMPDLPGFNMLSAGLVMGVMVVPYIVSLAEDAMRAVPMSMREGSFAMGATRFQTAVKVIFPAAISGLVSAYILAISRVLGETMVVSVAAGQQPILTFNPTESASTITAYIVQVVMSDLPHGSIGYQSIFAAGLVLFVMTLSLNMLGQWIRKKYRQQY